MKKLLLTLLLLPALTFGAIVAPWNATSTDKGGIQPTAINGNIPYIIVPGFISTASSSINASVFNLLGLSNGCLNITGNIIGSTGSACGSGGFAFPFATFPTYNSTNTPIVFNAGLVSNSSTTINSNLQVNADIILKTGQFIKSGANTIFGGNGFNTLFRPDSSGGEIQIQNFAGGTNSTFYDDAHVVFGGDASVPDEVYGAGWNGSLEVPTKNAVYDQMETKDSILSFSFPLQRTTNAISFVGLSTSSPIAAGGAVLYATGVRTLASVATSTPTVTSPITYSGTLGSYVGGVAGTFGCATCVVTSRQLTVAGTANQITSSAGAQDLSADRTWTLSIPSQFNISQSSSTLSSFLGPVYFGRTATTTIDSVGNIVLPVGANLTDTGTSDGCATWASAVLTSTGVACGSGGGSDPFSHTFPWLSATTSAMAIGTSTIPVTNAATLTLATSTSAQLMLSTGVGGQPMWAFRNAGGNFFLSSTSVSGLSTTTPPALFIGSDTGNVGLATSTTIRHGITIDGSGNQGVDLRSNNGGDATVSFGRSDTPANWLAGRDNTDNAFGIQYFSNSGASILDTTNRSLTILPSVTGGNVGISTSTPSYLLDIFSSTLPQLALSGGGGVNQYTFRNAGGYLYIGPTTVAGNATTTVNVTIDPMGEVGVGGVTNPAFGLHIASTTGGQLGLQGLTTDAMWSVRTIGNNLYLSTSTVANPNATTTINGGAPIEISGTGSAALGIGTSTLFATLAVNPVAGAYQNQFVVGSSTATNFRIDNSGFIFAPNTLSSGASQTGYWCYDTLGQLIRDSAVCLVSARKFKTDINTLTVGLEDLNKIRFVSYLKKDPLNKEDSHLQMGVIADDVAKISPELNEMLVTYVGGGTTGEVHAFRYDQFTALLGKSIQELNVKVDAISQKAKRSVEENWQWIAMFLMFLWIIRLEIKTRK